MTHFPGKKNTGATGFSQKYWRDNYNDPDSMDGIYNATEHAQYAKALFSLEYIEIGSLIDLGFGTGHMLKAFMAEFFPHTVLAIDPSPYAHQQTTSDFLEPIESTDLQLLPLDIVSWCEQPSPHEDPFDLGICASVFQYLNDEELHFAMPILSQRIKFLYFSVPTDKELSFQAAELVLDDRDAIARSKQDYLDILQPHYTIVSKRILESRTHFDESNTLFLDLLYRF